MRVRAGRGTNGHNLLRRKILITRTRDALVLLARKHQSEDCYDRNNCKNHKEADHRPYSDLVGADLTPAHPSPHAHPFCLVLCAIGEC